MTEAVIFLVLFLIAYKVMDGITHGLLFLAAIANVLIYPFTTETSVVLNGTVDLVFVTLIIMFGGRYWKTQAKLLMVALFCHAILEYYRVTGPDMLFSIYGTAITIITIGQLLGAGHAILNRFAERLWVNNNIGQLFCYSFDSVLEEVCQKKQQKY